MGKTISEQEYINNCLTCPVPDECNWKDKRCPNREFHHPESGNMRGIIREKLPPKSREEDIDKFEVNYYKLRY